MRLIIVRRRSVVNFTATTEGFRHSDWMTVHHALISSGVG